MGIVSCCYVDVDVMKDFACCALMLGVGLSLVNDMCHTCALLVCL